MAEGARTTSSPAARSISFSADTGGNPAGTKTKAQELIERDKVDAILGPLAAFELLAITDYVAQHKTPMLSLAGAEDMTQRKPNPYFLRPSACSSQAMHPMADYAAKELKLKKVVTISEDFAFGYEQMGGFQQTFEDDGGKIVNKIWPPLVTPDYTPFVAQIADCDGVCQGFAGSNPLRFMKTYAAAGLKFPVVTGETGGDDALLRAMGDEVARHVQLLPLHARSADRRQQALRRGDAERLQRGPWLLRRRPLRQLPRWSTPACKGQWQIRRQGSLRQGAALGRTSRRRRADRSSSTTSATSSAISISAASRKANGLSRQQDDQDLPQRQPVLDLDEKKFLAQPVYSRNYPPLKS